MQPESALHRSQVYRFLASALLYPKDNWLEDLPDLRTILEAESFDFNDPFDDLIGLEELQEEHRHTFGLSGSLCYETEVGLPNEFQQSQQLADINGFYRAFSLSVGGSKRERPDHIAMELEFMSFLNLKEAYALSNSEEEHAQICVQAQCGFLRDHLGRWVPLFAQGINKLIDQSQPQSDSITPYGWLTQLAASFVAQEIQRLGVTPEQLKNSSTSFTPYPTDLNCAGCEVAESEGAL